MTSLKGQNLTILKIRGLGGNKPPLALKVNEAQRSERKCKHQRAAPPILNKRKIVSLTQMSEKIFDF